jgi:hypothetical protein
VGGFQSTHGRASGRRRLSFGAVLCAATLLTASACSAGGADRAGTNSETPSSSPATASALPSAEGSASASRPDPNKLSHEPTTAYPDLDNPDQSRTPVAAPSWDESSRKDAAEAARQAMTLFARPDVEKTTWWKELSPRLSPEARSAYQGVDPANVTATTVTGTPDVETSASSYLATVSVQANDGTWMVLLSRDAAGEPWLVERFTPPGAN